MSRGPWKKKPTQKNEESVIEPAIRFNGEEHILEKLFKADEAPEVTSIGFMRMSQSNSGWVTYKITSHKDKIIKFEVQEPTLKQIAEDQFKTEAVNTFMDLE